MILREKETGVIFGDGFLVLDEKGAHTSHSVMTGVSPETHELIEGSLPPAQLDNTDNNRTMRNSLLKDSDWTQLSDVNLTAKCQADFIEYRAALREINLSAPVWPTMPLVEWS
jgi:hypothetical protein